MATLAETADISDVGHIDPPDQSGSRDGDGDPIQWVTVATFWRTAEAHIARLKLESEDIDCLIADENIIATDALLAPAVGGIKVQVPRPMAGTARELLGTSPHSPRREFATPSTPLDVCPECGSDQLARPVFQKQTVWAALIALMMIGTVLMIPLALAGFVYYLLMWRPWRCCACGNTFRRGEGVMRGFPVIVKDDPSKAN